MVSIVLMIGCPPWNLPYSETPSCPSNLSLLHASTRLISLLFLCTASNQFVISPKCSFSFSFQYQPECHPGCSMVFSSAPHAFVHSGPQPVSFLLRAYNC
eukprot:12793_2